MTSINFLKLKNVKTFLTKVSEEIDKQYIKEYLFTQIQSQNLTLDNNSQIHYSYIESIKSYQISIINSKNKNVVLEPFVFVTKYLDKNDKSTDLFICNDFFALYDNGQLVYFNHINNDFQENALGTNETKLSGFEKNDIIEYINQTFTLNINNTYDIDEKQLLEYEKEYSLNIEKLPKIKYISKKSNKNSIFYLIYLFIILTSLAIYFINFINQTDINMTNNMKDIKLETAKNEYNNLLNKYKDNKKITSYLINLFNTLNNNDIKLISLKVSQNKSQIKIKAGKKEVLLDFLDYYDEDSIINNMTYIKEDNSYEITATIKLYK